MKRNHSFNSYSAIKWLSTRLLSAQVLLGIIIIIELSLMMTLLIDRRLVLHDSFSRLSVQYFLMNNVVNYGELPRWIPYFTHGATALPWYSAGNPFRPRSIRISSGNSPVTSQLLGSPCATKILPV